MVKVIFLMFTFNRLRYTKEALGSLMRNTYPFHLVIYDNASTEPGMRNFLNSVRIEENRIVDIVFSEKNRGLSEPTNIFWKTYKDRYSYLGKIDNDTIVPEDAVERLVDIMDHCQDVGICHAHHWIGENFSQRRLRSINGRILLKTRWGGGCFYVIRSSIVQKYGYISAKYGKMGGWTRYQIKVRRRRNKIVYAYPLVKVKHLGDLQSGRNEEKIDYVDYNLQIQQIRKKKS